MKSKLVKVFMSLMVSSCMLIGLTACSSTNSSGNSNQSGSNSTAKSGENSESGSNTVDELYWFSDVSGWGPATANWTIKESPATKYIENTIGLSLKIEQPPTDAKTKLGLMIASGELPDLMSISDSDSYKQLVDSGKVWKLEEFFAEYAKDSSFLDNFPEDVKKTLVDTYGDWYSYPSHMESANNRETFPPNDQIWIDLVEKGSNGAIMFNTDIMEALGITEEDVSTEEGFLAACEKVKTSGHQVNGQAVIPVVLQGNLWINTSLDGIIASNFGALPVDANGDYRHLELSEGYKNGLKFCNTLIQKGYLDVNTLTIDETALKTYLEANRVFCWIGNQAQLDKTGRPIVSFGPILAGNGAKPVLGVNMSAGKGWIQTLISKDCKNPEKIAELLTWASSKEGLLMNYYGEEGVNYNMEDGKFVVLTEEGKKILADTYDSNVLMWPFANTSFERHTEVVPDPESQRGKEAQIMPAFGNHPDTYIYDYTLLTFRDGTVIEPSSDLGIKEAQIKSYLESQKAKIVTATSDEAFETEYNNMMNTLNEYGIADVDAEYNKLYKEYCTKVGKVIEDVNADLYK